MFQIISRSRILQTVTIVDMQSNIIPICLTPGEPVYSKSMTDSMKNLKENRQISIFEVNDIPTSEKKSESDSNIDSGSMSESMTVIKQEESSPRRRRKKKVEVPAEEVTEDISETSSTEDSHAEVTQKEVESDDSE